MSLKSNSAQFIVEASAESLTAHNLEEAPQTKPDAGINTESEETKEKQFWTRRNLLVDRPIRENKTEYQGNGHADGQGHKKKLFPALTEKTGEQCRNQNEGIHKENCQNAQ